MKHPFANTFNVDSLRYSWTAEVKLNNDKVVRIWHTCWPTIKSIVKEILVISSDYPQKPKRGDSIPFFSPY